jgi:hypothetical protein
MATNTKIRTEDVLEILDTKIKTSSAHAQLDVSVGEFYDSVLAKIAARSPTLDEKDALDGATSPSAINPYLTLNELTATIDGTIPWKTIGPIGSGADFIGSDETPFIAAFATADIWFYVMPGTYTFTVPVTIPTGIRLAGGHTWGTQISSAAGGVFILTDNVYISYMNLISTDPLIAAVTASTTSGVEIRNCMISATATSATLDCTVADNLTVSDTAFFFGTILGAGLTTSSFSNIYVDAIGVDGLHLLTPTDVVIWGSTFLAGTFVIDTGTNIRVVGNHFNNAISNLTPVSSVLFRANTPNSNNNEDESLTALLQYLGSPPELTTTPSYSNNFAGPQAQDLTARASSLDLLLQWRYEERNFSLVAATEPMVVTWTPSTNTLSTDGSMYLVSAHRDGRWGLAQITPTVIPTGWFLYYILDRSLAAVDIPLTAQLGPIGSFPLEANPPGSPDNRQIITLAFNLNGTLWWRGGGGSRFPDGQVGEYFVDGTSKSTLTYIGATDYNDSDPAYTNNFAGINGESLTTRSGKASLLIQRLFEHSNLGYYLADDTFMYSDTVGNLDLSGTIYFTHPHYPQTMSVSTQTWVIPDGDILYFSWNHAGDQVATTTVASTVPLPDDYTFATSDKKYFVAAAREGNVITLWDGTRIPVGGRWSVPHSRSVVPTAFPSILRENLVWDTTDFLWESIAVSCATGISLDSNLLTDQTTPLVGLTDLSDGEGLLITHTWNEQGAPTYVAITKETLPLSLLEQNQFLWVQNRGGYLIFE